ncbi:hypothetical protein WJX81_000845 [Elliptochloris bilobata]|uniref:RNA helicase n=1 Tax=Elliptochloris bilobata TaxID=381761 RepID=A0AAW1RGG8_9CHLO
MTGLNEAENSSSYMDDIEDRYRQMAASGRAFLINQFGLAMFQWDGQRYSARTFNFYLFPRPFQGYDRRFMCQAGSMDFLAGQGFDFNKFVYEGVSSMPAALRDERLATVRAAVRSNEIKISRPDDAALVEALVARVSAWLQGDEMELLLEEVNNYQRAIQYQQLEKPQFGAVEPPGFYFERVESPTTGRYVIRLTRAAPADVAAFNERQVEERVAAIHKAAGFTSVFEAMRDCGKPAVGHNVSLDLSFSLAAFAGPLPGAWQEYKRMVQQWLPGGVWDTKHLARHLAKLFRGRSTSLGDIHAALVGGLMRNEVEAFLDEAAERVALTGEPSACQWRMPEVVHAPGFDLYTGEDAAKHAHEAGYDAYMTGAVQPPGAELANGAVDGAAATLESGAVAVDGAETPEGGSGFDAAELARGVAAGEPGAMEALREAARRLREVPLATPPLQTVQAYKGQVHLMASDLPHAALWGPDPPPDRAHVYYVSGLPPGGRQGDLQRPLAAAGLGRLRVSMRARGTQAVVEVASRLGDTAANAAALRSCLRLPHAQVLTHAEFAERKRAGSILSGPFGGWTDTAAMIPTLDAKGGRKAAAEAAAHSAGRRKASAVELTADNEARVRSALAGLQLEQPTPAARAPRARVDAHAVAAVYDSLLTSGFREDDVRQALQALAGSEITQEAALDWICLHVDPARLPRRFAGNARSHAAAAGADPAKALADKDAQRRWILQYAQEQPSSGDEGSESDGEIEDWELWADPREIERRKAERARARMPFEERRKQVAVEWATVRAEAHRAKAAADKPRQKAAGQLIEALKREIASLGLTEAAVEAAAAELALTRAAWPGPREGGGIVEESGEPNDAWPQLGTAGLQPGLFDEAADPEQWNAPARVRPADPLGPWGGYGAGPKRVAKLKGKGRPQPVVEVKLPKALLQQHCQRQGWPPPRFERCAAGGVRLPTAGIRYSVTLETPAAGGGRRKALLRPRAFTLREEDDGWESIQEAQNAAATLALHAVVSEAEPQLWQQLAPLFQGLWLSWAAEAGDGGAAGRAAADEAGRLAFARSLLAQGGDGGQPERRNGSAGVAARAQPAEGDALRAPQGGVPEEAPMASPVALTREEEQEGARMRHRLETWRKSPEGAAWGAKRGDLPVVQIRDGLLAALETADVAVVGGDTGCGKTTQVPQFLLDAAIEGGLGARASLICTQPRRIAAISVAERVASERGQPAPGSEGAIVGYHVRLDAATTAATRLLFCTTGILLRRLASDPTLARVSHVIVDEVHERTLQGDFLMALLRDIVATRRVAGNPLKVVLMSATLDSDLFARYFGGCAVLAAGGRTFPVQHHFLEDAYAVTGYRLAPDSPAALCSGGGGRDRRRRLEHAAGQRAKHLVKEGWGDDEADVAPLNRDFDAARYADLPLSARRNLARVDETRIDYELLEELVAHIYDDYDEGAILVFLPGMGEITATLERLTATAAHRTGRMQVLPLHSSVSPQEQRRIFLRPPPGVRKVVLATNIAETSLTIEDVVYVIDTGKLKERRYDAGRGMSLLVEDFVSRASALQRRGRAGRVRPGHCFGLYTRHRFEHRLRKFQAPEMVRVPLEELVLQIHLLRLGPAAAFLANVLEPPPAKSVAGALAQLQAIGALTADERLTPLGHHLAQLPVDAKIGKLLLLAASLGCLAPCLTIAACLSHRSPFVAGFDQQDAAQRAKAALAAPGADTLAAGQQSDHLVMAAVLAGWEAACAQGGRAGAAAYAKKHLLAGQTLDMLSDMRRQFSGMLADARFVSPRGGARSRASDSKGAGSGAGWADDPAAVWNRHAAQPAVVKAALCAALYPNAAVMDESGGAGRPAWNDGTADVHIHPSSSLHALEAPQFSRPYLVYLEKVKTSRTFLRDCTVVSPMALLLFGGALAVQHEAGLVLVDDWLRIRASAPTAVLVKKLRAALDALLESKVRRPEADLAADGSALVDTIVKVLRDEEAAQARR